MADIPVPDGLNDMLQNFVVSLLRERPADLVDFAAQYFTDLLEHRDQLGGGQLPATMDSMDEDTESDDGFDEELARRFASQTRRKSVAAEGFDPDAPDDEDEERVVHAKTDVQRGRLNKACEKILLFSSLDMDQMQQVLDAMFERVVTPGEHVIDEGDDGDFFYVIESGNYDIFKKKLMDDGNEVQIHVGSYSGSGAFGELALMYNCPRAATIVATSEGSLWAMDRATFRRIIVKNNARKRKQYEEVLAMVPCLSTLTMEERQKVADAMHTKTYDDGAAILNQGDAADFFYIVMEGEVVIKRRGDNIDNPSEEVVLQHCERGNYFGELALLTNQPRAASVFAVGRCVCAVLDVQAFERLLGPCQELMRRNIPLYEQQLSQIYQDMNI